MEPEDGTPKAVAVADGAGDGGDDDDLDAEAAHCNKNIDFYPIFYWKIWD